MSVVMCMRSEEWVAAIRYVSSQLSAGGPSAGGGALPESDDRDMAQLGTSFRDPRRIVSTARTNRGCSYYQYTCVPCFLVINF